ncbi:DUF1294 domain-containing protein [Chitinibacter bivalviorum]|uniref:DUF1294 domain-containing protein n=1 Tax=Chitinibacter bivalviorum TaxID=2739434 RepID=A0A7H9BII2_9NEIS|nr:cold shock and DUF1294 domain-containing protein [Chitinibacter bivalviorum]QLG88533.1 DUF1294 domain-containing protein [Chitinibacter bivalviorum]
MKKGKLVQWNGAKGFGFIQTESAERVFVHISTLKRAGYFRPKAGDVVLFEQGTDAKGRVQAISIAPKKGGQAQAANSANSKKDMIDYLMYGLLPLFLLMVLSSPTRLLLGALVLMLSALVFGMYWFDKRQASKGGWRVPEANLHMVSLLGGWPGAWLAQQSLRHKTQKTTFRVAFLASAMLSVVGLAYLISEKTLLAAWAL